MNCSSTTGARSRPLGPMLPLSRIHSHAAPCAPHLVAPVPAMGLRMQQQSVGGPPPPPMLVTPSRVSAMVPAPAHPSHLAPVVPPSPLLLHFLAMVHAPPPAPYTPSSASSTTAGSAESENYEALLSLAERLGDAKPRGLTRQQLDQLPSYRFTAVEQPSAQLSSCVICMCDFEQRQTLRVLPCSHQFHAKCVDKWLKVSAHLHTALSPILNKCGNVTSSFLTKYPCRLKPLSLSVFNFPRCTLTKCIVNI